MKYTTRKKATLILEDGTIFNGTLTGSEGISTGEICFNTGMTGYQEIFTDPSYYNQILCMSTPHVGNYGANTEDVESESIKIAGLVTNDFSWVHSRVNSISNLNDYLIKNKITGITDVDTRKLVEHIRVNGAQNAIIGSEEYSIAELKQKLSEVPSMKGLELASKVSTDQAYFFGDESAPLKVAVLDFGVKQNILRCLAERGAYLKVFPVDSTLDEILAFNPNGIMLSNGPGDPEAMPQTVELIKAIVEKNIPTFGICLGHQLLSLSVGLNTYKMHNGHRGVNHPIKNLLTGKCEITSQNHGFVVDLESANQNQNIIVTHTHLNDHTLAGIRLKEKPIFSVQYHPESSAGPNDSRYLFDEFINLMRN